MNKTILITGASTGIGKITAIYFAGKGWNVAATMRDTKDGADLSQYKNIKLFTLDVTDETSIQKAIEDTLKTFGAIDVIFNNAGYALVGAFEMMTQEQIKKQFDTNVFGVMNVTRAILPYFRKRKNGTIINNTSQGGLITFPLYSVYHATKWAVEGFMESLHYELKPFNIKIKNIEPGATKTAFENAIEFVTADPYNNYVPKVHQNMLDSLNKAHDPAVVAKKVFQLANDNSFRLRYRVGSQARLLLFLRGLLPDRLFFAVIRSAVEMGVKNVRE